MRVQITIHFRITTREEADAFLASLGGRGIVLTLSGDCHEGREFKS